MGQSLDREVVRRVLRRANELAGDEPGTDLASIDEDTLIEAADEVGIPVPAVRRAIAIERLGPAPAGRAGDVVLGSSVVVVDVELDGSADDTMAHLDAWFVAGHHLRRERRRQGRVEWAKRPGLVGTTVRTVRSATGEGRLGRLRKVSATARDTGAGSCVVRVEADRTAERRTMAGEGAAVAVIGTAGVGLGVLVAGPVVLIATPVALLVGVAVASRGRRRAGHVEAEVRRVLDAVDEGSAPVRLTTDVARRVAGRHR